MALCAQSGPSEQSQWGLHLLKGDAVPFCRQYPAIRHFEVAKPQAWGRIHHQGAVPDFCSWRLKTAGNRRGT